MIFHSYVNLFELLTKNEFNVSNADNLNDDLRLEPTADTSRFMRNQKMVFRKETVGYRVAVKVKQDGSPFIDLDTFDFRFGLFVKEDRKSTWFNVTSLKKGSKSWEQGKLAFFRTRNNLNTADLKYELLDGLRPNIWTFGASDVKSTLKVTDFDDNPVEVVFDGIGDPIAQPYTMDKVGTDDYELGMNFSALPPGRYKFETEEAGSTDKITNVIYIDNELYAQQPFGIVEIKTAATPGVVAAKEYEMNYSNRNTKWRYYIVNKSGISMVDYEFAIVDTAGATAPYESYVFNSKGPTEVNGLPAEIFESAAGSGTAKVPFFDTPKTGLELQKIDLGITGEIETLITNLPNPALNGLSKGNSQQFSDVYVFV